MKTMNLQIADGLSVQVIPNITYGFMMPTEDVAKGYGVKASTIREHKRHNMDELIEGEHFLTSSAPTVRKTDGRCKSNCYSDNLQTKQVYWTKAGIIRLGFFIKSNQAKQFRCWAEKLILREMEQQQTQRQAVVRYKAESNMELGLTFQNLAYRELLRVENGRVRNRIASLIEFYITQIQD